MKFKELSRDRKEIRVPSRPTHLILFARFQSYNPLLLESTISATKAESYEKKKKIHPQALEKGAENEVQESGVLVSPVSDSRW